MLGEKCGKINEYQKMSNVLNVSSLFLPFPSLSSPFHVLPPKEPFLSSVSAPLGLVKASVYKGRYRWCVLSCTIPCFVYGGGSGLVALAKK